MESYQAADLDPNEVGVVTVIRQLMGHAAGRPREWASGVLFPKPEIVQSEARPTIVDDMTATLDELDTVRSSAPDFASARAEN